MDRWYDWTISKKKVKDGVKQFFYRTVVDVWNKLREETLRRDNINKYKRFYDGKESSRGGPTSLELPLVLHR